MITNSRLDFCLCGGILVIFVSALNAAGSNGTGDLFSSFDFSFASKPEPNTCKSTDMCSTMSGMCIHGKCRSKPCSNAFVCDCNPGWSGIYCETQNSTSDTGKTLVNGDVNHTLMKGSAEQVGGQHVDNGFESTKDNSNGNGNGIDNGAPSTHDNSKDNGNSSEGNNKQHRKATTAKRNTSAFVDTTTTQHTTTTVYSEKLTVSTDQIPKLYTSTKDMLKIHADGSESVGDQINQKLENGEIKVENVLDVLIASVKENEALAKNKSKLHASIEEASIETTIHQPMTTSDATISAAETSTIITSESTSKSTIHPDGSFIKGPESTYLSDNGPLNLEAANKTIKDPVNNWTVKNTTDTVTIPFTVLTLSGITVSPKKKCTVNCTKESNVNSVMDTEIKTVENNTKNITTNVNSMLKENNEEKLVKIVESIVIHKPKESFIKKGKGIVNIHKSPIGESAKQEDRPVSSNKKSDNHNHNLKLHMVTQTVPMDQNTKDSFANTTIPTLEPTTQTT